MIRNACRMRSIVASIALLSIASGPITATSTGNPWLRLADVSAQKETLSPAQQKINSQLLIEIRRRAPKKAGAQPVPPAQTSVRVDSRGRALVDVRVEVTAQRERAFRRLGATIVSTSAEYRSIVAWIPLARLERIAEDPAVRAIEPNAEAVTSRPRNEVDLRQER